MKRMNGFLTVLCVVLAFVAWYLLGNIYPVIYQSTPEDICDQEIVVSGSVVETNTGTIVSDTGNYIVERETTEVEDINADINSSSTEPEKFQDTPVAIKKIFQKSNETYFSVDVLSPNPDWVPGQTPFFLNKSTKLRAVAINDSTKYYFCGNDNLPDVLVSQQSMIDYINMMLDEADEYDRGVGVYVDIEGSIVKSIYQQCLP